MILTREGLGGGANGGGSGAGKADNLKLASWFEPSLNPLKSSLIYPGHDYS